MWRREQPWEISDDEGYLRHHLNKLSEKNQIVYASEASSMEHGGENVQRFDLADLFVVHLEIGD